MYSVLNFLLNNEKKLPLILLVAGLAGCQQKSEVDKCVEAIVKASSDSKTTAQDIAVSEAMARIDCLKAQAGGR